MSIVKIELNQKELEVLTQILESRIRDVENRLREIESRLRYFERKYGVSSSQLLEIIEGAEGRRAIWPLPNDADMDVVEWEGYAKLYNELKKEEKLLKYIAAKLKATQRNM